jgi:hypothetical protein
MAVWLRKHFEQLGTASYRKTFKCADELLKKRPQGLLMVAEQGNGGVLGGVVYIWLEKEQLAELFLIHGFETSKHPGSPKPIYLIGDDSVYARHFPKMLS